MEKYSMNFNGNKIIKIQSLFTKISNSFTYEFWIKPTASIPIDSESLRGVSGTSGQRYVIGPGHGVNVQDAGVGVSVGTNGVIVYEHSSNYLPALLVYSISITDWIHIAVVYREKTPYLYINGEFMKKGLTSQKENVYASGLIGGIEPYGYYIGLLRELRIWNHARSDTQIQDTVSGKLTGDEDGLYGYWTFDEDDITFLNKESELYIEGIFKRDKKILFIKSGNGVPYVALENAIVKSLKSVIQVVKVTTQKEDFLNLAKNMKPDLVIHFAPTGLPREQIGKLKRMGIKTAIWLTDDPYYTDLTKRSVPSYDFVFTQELNCVPLYKSLGCTNVYYLPLAAETNIFHPQNVGVKYQSEILFVGVAFWNRVRLFDSLAKYLSNKKLLIVGPYWNRLKNYHLLKGNIKNVWLSPEETAKYYNGAKIVINIHRQHNDRTINFNRDKVKAISINPRTFEIAACGAFQLTDIRQNLSNCYLPGQEIATFNNHIELKNQLDYYLTNGAIRREIAQKALIKTTAEHTYLHRINRLLEIVY